MAREGASWQSRGVTVSTRGRDENSPIGAAPLASRLGLRAEPGEDGPDLLRLTSCLRGDAEVLGAVRRYRSEGGEAEPDREVMLVSLVISMPILGLFVERLYGFAPPSSAIPHLLVEARRAGNPAITTVTADLLPRVDLAVHPTYMEDVYGPLEAELQVIGRRLRGEGEGLVATSIETPPRRRAMASPWATTVTLVDPSRPQEEALIATYRSRWEELLGAAADRRSLENDRELGSSSLSLADRDRRLREGLALGRDDPLWKDLRRLCGDAQVRAIAAWVRGDAARA